MIFRYHPFQSRCPDTQAPSIRCDACQAICWRQGLSYLPTVKSNNHPFYDKRHLQLTQADRHWHEDVKTTSREALLSRWHVSQGEGKHQMSQSHRAAVHNSIFCPAPHTAFIDTVYPLPDQISLSLLCLLLIFCQTPLRFFFSTILLSPLPFLLAEPQLNLF